MIELNEIEDINRIADWIELDVACSSSPISKSKLISLLEDNGHTDDGIGGEAMFDNILQKLQMRASRYGAKSPYKIQNNVVEPVYSSWQDVPEYVMCLIFSYLGAPKMHAGTKLFEKLSMEALKCYLNGSAAMIGFPATDPLTAQIDRIATSLCERRGSRSPASSDKDRGVDVIGWKSFDDSRNSQIIVLMQCAAGKNWALKKPIPLNSWRDFICWNHATAIPSISVAQALNRESWQNHVDDYGIVFDRPRIFKHIYADNYPIDNTLRQDIITWCQEQIN